MKELFFFFFYIHQPLLVLEFSQGSRQGIVYGPLPFPGHKMILPLSNLFFESTSHGVGEMENRLSDRIVLKKKRRRVPMSRASHTSSHLIF